jgi:hypothetical protein
MIKVAITAVPLLIVLALGANWFVRAVLGHVGTLLAGT